MKHSKLFLIAVAVSIGMLVPKVLQPFIYIFLLGIVISGIIYECQAFFDSDESEDDINEETTKATTHDQR